MGADASVPAQRRDADRAGETREIEKPAPGRLLDRLEAKGGVRRRHGERGRRVRRIHLTDEAEPVLLALRALAAERPRGEFRTAYQWIQDTGPRLIQGT